MTTRSDADDAARLQQYIESIPDDQWPIAKAWLARSIDTDDQLACALMVLVSQGFVIIQHWDQKQGPMITLTEAGRDQALDLVQTQQSMRDFYMQMTGRAMVAPSQKM